ncbi:hypothetical protein Acid345_2504 [Candidatus Koribacter versatilis Ellin345]|uniref:DUF885 domain-containing protein n=2 Tax=Candidatus Korobacter versatilis TaxID=658062 RepID=Q1INP5_KORVE|nr:hypothetical protein Acid345_2504 [Candidatus Koribacter versatilis Ellin345]
MRFATFLLMLVALSAAAFAQRRVMPIDDLPPAVVEHHETRWDVRPSLKYDALCALNVLSGDPYYLKFYQADYDRLAPKFTPAEKAEFVALKRIIKDQNKGIISADLALILSVEPGDSLDDMLVALDKPNDIRERLKQTPYYSAPNFTEFMQVRPHAIAAIRALKRVGFDEDWSQHIRPQIMAKAPQIEKQLVQYNIVPLQEQVLGHALPDNRIEVDLLYYSQPHGIKITGTRFLTHFEYPFDIVLHNAVHEMMHPPYDLKSPATVQAIESLRHDAFLMDKVKHHDPSYGYNEFEGFVEEDCVQALEQTITQSMGMKEDEREYWRIQDGGMHVLAIALYELMQRERFMELRESFPHFLRRMVASGKLTNERLVQLNREFYAGR